MPSANMSDPTPREIKPLSAGNAEWCAVSPGNPNIVPIYKRPASTLPVGGVTPITSFEMRRVIRNT